MGTSDLGFALGGHRVQWNRTDPNDRVKGFRGVNHCGPYPISEPNATFGPKRPPIRMRAMPDPRTLAETESAMNRHIEGLEIDFAAAHTVSSLYRAANAVRAHITNAVLRQYDLTWSGFVVMWVVWIWDGMETPQVAESAAISKATLTGVVKTLTARGLLVRTVHPEDGRLVLLSLSPKGARLMEHLFPAFNSEEAFVVTGLRDHE